MGGANVSVMSLFFCHNLAIFINTSGHVIFSINVYVYVYVYVCVNVCVRLCVCRLFGKVVAAAAVCQWTPVWVSGCRDSDWNAMRRDC